MRILELSLFSVALLAAADVYLKDDSLVNSVQSQVRQVQPTRAERRFDEIGWAASILAAEATAAKVNRPVFLFTYNGNIDTGRCWGGAFGLRAGSLSDPKVIDILNKYFVPVTSKNEEAAEENGSGPPEEKRERQRIYLEFYGKKLGIGDVHVYIVAPDKSAVASLSVVDAQEPGKMIPFLEGIVAKLHVPPGAPAIRPHPTSRPPVVTGDSLVIHLVSRALAGGSWHEFPAENWIVLSRTEWNQLLPAEPVPLKSSWAVPQSVAGRLAEWVYPQNEEKTGKNRSRVDVAEFRMTAVAVQGSLVRARIQGKIRLLHSFAPGGGSQDFAVSELNGYMDFDIAQHRIQRLRIVTTKADHNGTPFATSLVSMSKETLDALAP
jgi:hypothetical protein